MKQIFRILLAVQTQANKPIFLYENGCVCCGCFRYSGRYKKYFSEIYKEIVKILNDSSNEEINVSNFKYWSAIDIYNEIIIPNWLCSISSEQIELFAKQSIITININEIREEFLRAVNLRWRKTIKNANVGDNNVYKQAWQIL